MFTPGLLGTGYCKAAKTSTMDTITVTQHILGTTSAAFFFAMLFFALLGLVANLLLNATDRNPSTTTTPEEFSLKFLLRDNWKRIVLSIVLVLIGLLLMPELFGVPLNKFTATLLGGSLDRVAQALKNRNKMLQVKRKEPTEVQQPIGE